MLLAFSDKKLYLLEAKFAFKSQSSKYTFSYNLELETQPQKTDFCFLHFCDVMQAG